MPTSRPTPGNAYDLVIVGGGISGLSAAYFYRKTVGDNARILILDVLDDFGGHAKRNEFDIDGRKDPGLRRNLLDREPQSLQPHREERHRRPRHRRHCRPRE